jgi:hypothetical protein
MATAGGATDRERTFNYWGDLEFHEPRLGCGDWHRKGRSRRLQVNVAQQSSNENVCEVRGEFEAVGDGLSLSSLSV